MYQRTARKSHLKREMKVDKISNLPSDVIEKILSHLPIREAVRTSVLSRKWRYKWAMLPHLVFDDRCVSTQNHTTFVNIVDQVLVLHIGPIHKFHLCHQNLLATSDIDRWILHLSRNSIKQLILEIWIGPRYKTPSCLFSCQDLVHLELYNCFLKPPSTLKGFRSLKSLYLDNVTLAQDVLENLIACCPLLERMTLWSCEGFPHLKINAPNLQLLEVVADFEYIILQNTLSLADFEIHLDANVDQRLVPGSSSNAVNFFVQLPQIRRLTMQGYCLKYLAIGALPGKLPQPCLYLNFLSIHIHFNNLEDILTARCLLRSSPALQELHILTEQEEEDPAVTREVNSWLDDSHNCPFPQLRLVIIAGVSGVKAKLDFIRFLLLSAPVLERMIVELEPACVHGFKETGKELHRSRRVSAHAEIIYWDPHVWAKFEV